MDDRISIYKPWMKSYNFHLIQDVEKLDKLIDICIQRKICSLDLETTGVDNRIYPDSYFEDGKITRHGYRTVDRIVGVCISFDGHNGYYIPLSHEPEDSGNLPWDPAWDILTKLVNKTRIIAHNSRFDFTFLQPVTGKDYWKKNEFEDTYFVAKILNPLNNVPAGLKPLAKIHYDVDMIDIHDLFTQEKKEQLKLEKKGPNFSLLHPKEGLEYGCSDGIFTYKLWFTLKEKFSGNDAQIYDLEKTFSNVLRKMENNRVHIDINRVNELNKECQIEMVAVGDAIRQVIEEKTGNTGKWKTLNIGSPKQLSQAFITDAEGLRLKPTAEMLGEGNQYGNEFNNNQDSDDEEDEESYGKNEKQYTLKEEAMKSLHKIYGKEYLTQRKGKTKSESIFELVTEYKHYEKMKGSFMDKLSSSYDKYGDVRPSFLQIGTDTTRLSAKAGKIKEGYSGINFQGIPRDSDEDKPELFKQIRTCIIPRDGWILVKLDYAGEELRVVTNLSADPIWTKSFLYEDGDVHSITARTLFAKSSVNKDERNRGKRCNFAFIYGGGAGAIQRNIGCSIEDAQRHMNNLRHDVPVLMGYVDEQKNYARKYKCIYTAYGRRIPIQGIDSPIRGIRAKAERCAINYTIQATSADILKYAMCFVDKNIRILEWEDRVKYVLTVHDEVVYEVRPEYLMEVVKKLDEWMTYPWLLEKAHGRKWIVPLLTEPGIGKTWRVQHDYFKMVDGVILKPFDLDANGKYKGKLKPDEYIENGRIYQKIPDLLEKWIHKLQVVIETSGETVQKESSNSPESSKILNTPETSIDITEVPGTEIKQEQNLVIESKEEDIIVNINSTTEATIFKEIEAIKDDTEIKSIEKNIENLENLENLNNFILNKPVQSVFRWVLKTTPTEFSMRKLTAVCTLTEGEIPIRIINHKGEIIMNESEGIKINPEEFSVLSKLFGL